MTKKVYMKPELQDMGILEESELLAYSVTTTGLGDEVSQDKDNPSGDSWNDALSRRGVWNDGE